MKTPSLAHAALLRLDCESTALADLGREEKDRVLSREFGQLREGVDRNVVVRQNSRVYRCALAPRLAGKVHAAQNCRRDAYTTHRGRVRACGCI